MYSLICLKLHFSQSEFSQRRFWGWQWEGRHTQCQESIESSSCDHSPSVEKVSCMNELRVMGGWGDGHIEEL